MTEQSKIHEHINHNLINKKTSELTKLKQQSEQQKKQDMLNY